MEFETKVILSLLGALTDKEYETKIIYHGNNNEIKMQIGGTLCDILFALRKITEQIAKKYDTTPEKVLEVLIKFKTKGGSHEQN